MPIKAYANIPDSVLDETHTTQNGKTYTIRCDEKLVVDMSFKGKNQPTSNSQGWERNSAKYFQQLHQNHPEMFSAKNTARIQNNQVPIVDQKMIDHNPQFAQFKGEPLAHHHIGGDGQAAAVPRSIHMGYGEIHNHEKKAGITQNCKDFSQKCDNYVQVNTSAVGKNATEMSNCVGHSQAKSSSQTGNNISVSNATQNSGKDIQDASTSNARSEAVKSTLNSRTSQQNTQGNSQGPSRAQSVQDTLSGQSHSSSSSQSNNPGGQSSNFGGHSGSPSGQSSSSVGHGSSSGGHSSSSSEHSNGSGGQSK